MSLFLPAHLKVKVDETLKKVDDQVDDSRKLQKDLDEVGFKLDPSHAATYYGEDLDDDEDGVTTVTVNAGMVKAQCGLLEKDIKSLSTIFSAEKANQLTTLAQLPQPKLLQAIPKIPDQAYADMFRIVTNKEKSLSFLANLSDAHKSLITNDLRTFVKGGHALVDRSLREGSLISTSVMSDFSSPLPIRSKAAHRQASQQASHTKSSRDWQNKHQALLKQMEDMKREHDQVLSETRTKLADAIQREGSRTEECQRLQTQLTNLQSVGGNLPDILDENDALRERVDELEAAVREPYPSSQYIDEVTDLDTEIERLNAVCRNSDRYKEIIEQDLRDAENAIASHVASAKIVNKKCETLEADLLEEKQRSEIFYSEFLEYKGRWDKYQSNVEILTERLKVCNEEIRCLRTDLDWANERNSRQQSQLKTLKRMAKLAEDEARYFESQAKELTGSLKYRLEEIEELVSTEDQAIVDKKLEIRDLQASMQSKELKLLQQISAQDQVIMDSLARIVELEKDNKTLKASLKSKAQDMDRELSDKDTVIAQRDAKVEAAKSKLKSAVMSRRYDLADMARARKWEVDLKDREIDGYLCQLQGQKDEISDLEAINKSLAETEVTLQSEVTALESSASKLGADLGGLCGLISQGPLPDISQWRDYLQHSRAAENVRVVSLIDDILVWNALPPWLAPGETAEQPLFAHDLIGIDSLTAELFAVVTKQLTGSSLGLSVISVITKRLMTASKVRASLLVWVVKQLDDSSRSSLSGLGYLVIWQLAWLIQQMGLTTDADVVSHLERILDECDPIFSSLMTVIKSGNGLEAICRSDGLVFDDQSVGLLASPTRDEVLVIDFARHSMLAVAFERACQDDGLCTLTAPEGQSSMVFALSDEQLEWWQQNV